MSSKNITACIDASRAATAVCDAAAWAAGRLDAPIHFLHVLDRGTLPTESDLSGSIGLGSREQLLDRLATLDEQRGRLMLEHGLEMLEAAKERAARSVEAAITVQQRYGSLQESLVELSDAIRLVVMGRQGEAHQEELNAIGTHLETVVRSIERPILVVLPEFKAPQSFMIAYDASPTAEKALDMVAASPLLATLPCHLVMAGKEQAENRNRLDAAARKLEERGFPLKRALLDSDPAEGLSGYAADNGIDLLVMGAFGHSRIREFLVGSTTRKMISRSTTPLLVLR